MNDIYLINISTKNINDFNINLTKNDTIILNKISEEIKDEFFNLFLYKKYEKKENIIINDQKKYYGIYKKVCLLNDNYNLINNLTIKENIILLSKNEEESFKLVRKYNLNNTLDKYPDQIDYTQLKKVIYIIAIYKDFDLLLVDKFDSYPNIIKKDIMKIDKIKFIVSSDKNIINQCTKILKYEKKNLIIKNNTKEGTKNEKNTNNYKRHKKRTTSK